MLTKVIAILLTVVMMVGAVPPALAQGPSNTITTTKVFVFKDSSLNVAWSPIPLLLNGTVQVTTTVTPTTLSVLTVSNNITAFDPNTGKLYTGQPAPVAVEVQSSPDLYIHEDIMRWQGWSLAAPESPTEPPTFLPIDFAATISKGVPVAVNPVDSGSGPTPGVPRPPSGTMTRIFNLTPFTVFNPNTKNNVVVSGSAKVTTSVFSGPSGTISTFVIEPYVTGVDQTTGAKYVGTGSFAQNLQFPDTVPALGSVSGEFVLSNTTAIDDIVEYGLTIALVVLAATSMGGFDPATPPPPTTTP